MQDWVMEILRCPVTHSPLTPADKTLLASVNQRIAAGELQTRAGTTVSDPVEAGLVNQSQSLLYPIIDQIPNLIPDDAIVIGEVPPSAPNEDSTGE